jgi:hypothetical protein
VVGGGGAGPRSGGSGSAGVERFEPSARGVRGSRGSTAGGRDGVASATLPGDVVDGGGDVVVPGDAGVDGVAVEGVDAEGDDESTGRGVVDVASVAGFVSVGELLGSDDVPGVDAEGELLSVAPGCPGCPG